jgi:hypothetical protein
MKSHQYLILGIASTRFVIMLFYTAYPKNFIRDDNLNADDVFNEYIRNKLEESQTLNSQASKVDDCVQNLNIIKNILDGMELKNDTIGKRQSDTLNALPKILVLLKTSLPIFVLLLYLFSRPFQSPESIGG